MIQGAKGGGGAFKQTPDNLRSTDTFEGVLGLCVGPIKGPVRGLKSIKLDGTPVENETGEMNFEDFTALIADGDPTKFPQPVQLKLGAGASPSPVNVSITNPNDGAGTATPGPWVTRTLNNTNADFIDIRLIVQGLYRQDKKGIYETTATLEIEMKPTGSTTWVNPIGTTPSGTYNPDTGMDIFSKGQAIIKAFFGQKSFNPDGTWKLTGSGFTLTGKTTSPSVYELRIAVPNEGAYADTQWDVRIRLMERDDYTYGDNGEKQEKRTLSWESMAAVYGATMGEHEDWRGLAWAQLYGKASDQLTGVPEIEGEYYTKIVSVPPVAVFNPTTRQYTATIWDGSWSKAYTNDPAWVISDVISDGLSGLSLIAQGSFLNKWDALELSKWCSTLVSDGNGGTEPRYSLNIAVTEPQKAEEFVRYLGGAVGALVWDQGDGQWRCKVDKPEPAADIFTLDNIEGEFIYGHTDVDTRYNDIIGKFLNAEMDYREDSVRLYDNTSIAQIGRKPTTIALVGCTGRQEAMRRVKLRLRAAVNEYKIVSFTTNRRGRNIEPLSTILIADGDLGDQDKRTTGRLIDISGDRKTITVRDPMRLEAGVAYTLKFARPNPDYTPDRTTQPGAGVDWKNPTLIYSRTVMNTSGERGNVTVIKLDTALETDIATNMVVALEATGLATLPRMFRVTNVAPQDDGERISITAINIDTGKWDASDGVTKEDLVFQDLRGAPQPPTEIVGRPLLNFTTIPVEQGKQTVLQAAWLRPPGDYIRGFQIKWSINGGSLNDAGQQKMTEWELIGPQPGEYYVEVRTVGRDAQLSPPLVDYIIIDQNPLGAADITYDDGQTLEDLKPSEPGATNGMNPSEQALLDQLEEDVAAAEATVASVQATVNSDLAAMEASVSDVVADMAALETSVQSDITALETEIAGINPMATPNLLAGGDFEDGLNGWTQTGAWTFTPASPRWGNHVIGPTANGSYALEKLIPVGVVGATYTLSADVRALATSGTVRLILEWRNSGGTLLSTTAGALIPVGTEFDVTGAARKTYKVTGAVPTNATQVTVKASFASMTGISASGIAVRRVKFELGDKATSFTTEASSYTAYQTGVSNTGAIATINSTVSTLNSTVSTQATSISTLTSGLSTLTNTVNASSNANQLPNGGPENGTLGWTGGNGTLSQSLFSGGTYLRTSSTLGNSWMVSNTVSATAGNSYTLAAEIQLNGAAVTGSSYCRIAIIWSNGSGEISRSYGATRVGASAFDFVGSSRTLTAVVGAVAPAGTIAAAVLIEAASMTSGSASTLDARQIKFERGSIATPYSGEATASQTYTAYSTLNSSYAATASTVASQGSSISTLQSSMTTAQGSIATLTTKLTASVPNLVINGGFENGSSGWAVTSGSAGYFNFNANDARGRFLSIYNGGSALPSAYYLCDSNRITVSAGQVLTASARHGRGGTGIEQRIELLWYNASDTYLSTSSGPTLTNVQGLETSDRNVIALTATAPATATGVRVRLVYRSQGAGTWGDWSAVKLELGSSATAYTQEASIYQAYVVANTATSSLASLSTTVSTQGASISTLQSSMSTAQGDVATLKTQVRTGGGNLLTNTDIAADTSGWTFGTSGQTASGGRDVAGDAWRPTGEHNISMNQPNTTTTGYCEWKQTINVEPSAWYDVSTFAANHRCSVVVYIQWLDSAGAAISAPNSGTITAASGGTFISGWTYIAFKSQAPSNAQRATIILRKLATASGQADSYAWFCRPQVVETDAGASAGVAYSPGSARASIETVQTSVNGVLAKYGVTLDVNGYMTGFQQLNNGSTGSFIINADYFSIVKPGGGESLTWSSGAIIVDDGT